jgi:hypothetical protein
MRDQVRGILAEYMPLEGGDDLDGSSQMDFERQGQTSSLISLTFFGIVSIVIPLFKYLLLWNA